MTPPGPPSIRPFTEATPGPGPSWLVRALLVVLVMGSAYAVFAPVQEYGFLNYDDDAYVSENPLVRQGLAPGALARAFESVHSFTWHPLTTLSHMLDVQLFGLEAGAHHLTSLLLHAATAGLLLLVLARMTGAPWCSAFAAFLFAVHPLRVESVAWISERKDVLSGFLFVATLGAYERFARASAAAGRLALGRWLVVLLLTALALLSKPMVVTLPFVLLLLDHWPLGRLGEPKAPLKHLRARLLEKLPLFALSAACALVALRTQEGAMTSGETLGPGARLANAVVATAVYLRQLVWPFDLSVVYPHPRASLPVGSVVLAALVLAGISALAFAQRTRRPFLLVGWAWFLGMLVPVIGLVQVGIQAHADRYTYLPEIGLSLMLVWGIPSLGSRTVTRVAAALGAVSIVALAALARAQTAVWATSESLWRHALACTTRNAVAHAQLGSVLLEKGHTDEAVAHLEAALEIQPDYATPRYNLGNVIAGRGDLDGAIQQYELALQARPGYAEAYNNLGAAQAAQGRVGEALESFTRAVESDPAYASARINLAAALASAGRLDEAADHYRRVLRDDPSSRKARTGLGSILIRQGHAPEGIATYREAIALDPNDAEAHAQLGIALASTNQLEQALEHLRRAIALEPRSPTNHANLAMALQHQGDRETAAMHYRQALELARGRGDERLAELMRARLQELGVGDPGR